MKQSKFLNRVAKVAAKLMDKNGSTTTLEIKNKLRKKYPNENWNQQDVSDAMIELHANHNHDGSLQYHDNGHYREYFIKLAHLASPVANVTAKMAVRVSGIKKPAIELKREDLIQKIKTGGMCAIGFIKNDGSKRTIIGFAADPFMTNLGYISFLENGTDYKNVNPRTVESVLVNDQLFILKQ